MSYSANAAASLASRLYLRACHRLSVEGREHLPDRPPFVVAANHRSHLDAPAVMAALPRRLRGACHPLAADDYFFRSAARSLPAAWLAGALPLRRGRIGRRATIDLRRRLSAGESCCGLILFPEGTRGLVDTPAAFKPGVGMLVAGLAVPVVPAWIEGAGRALPKGRRLPRPTRVAVRFGPAATFAGESDDRGGWCRIAAQVRAGVVALRPAR